MHWWDIGSGLKAQLGEYLQKKGYEITEEAKLLGRSGIEHTFDLLAQKDDGFSTHTIAVCFVSGGQPEVEVDTIFSFANKAFDTGISTKIVIGMLWLSPKAKQFAQKQRVKVLEADQVTRLLLSKPTQSVKPKEPFRFETKEQLIHSLINMGYRVQRNAKIRGGSGITYTFDVLAYNNSIIDQLSQCLVVDFLTGEDEVSLKQVSLFDTRAFEVAIDNKVVIVSPRLSAEAWQFAQHRRIKVFELGERPVNKPIVTEEKFSLPKKEPTKAEKKSGAPAAETPTKHQSQSVQPEAMRLIPEVIAGRYDAVHGDMPVVNLPANIAEELGPAQVALFDTGACEVPIDNKVAAVSPQLSAEARQFGQQPRVKLFELGERPVANVVTEERPFPPKEESARAEEKLEAPSAEPPTECPRHAVQPEAWRLIHEVIAGRYNTEEKPSPSEEEPTRAEEKSEAPGFELDERQVADIVAEEKPSLPEEEPAKAEETSEVPGFELDERPAADMVAEEKPSPKLRGAAKLPPIPPSKEGPAKAEKKSEAPAVEPPTKRPRHTVQPEALRLISEVIAKKYNAVPLAISDDTLEVAMADPANTVAIGVLSTLSRMKIKPIATDANEIRAMIYFNYKAHGEIKKQIAPGSIPGKVTAGKSARSGGTDAPLTQAPNLIIKEEVEANASGVDVESGENGLGVRYRIDGILHDLMSLPPDIRLDLVSRIEKLPGKNIDDHRRS